MSIFLREFPFRIIVTRVTAKRDETCVFIRNPPASAETAVLEFLSILKIRVRQYSEFMQNHEHCIFDAYVHICKAVCMHLKMLGKITWSIYFSTRLHFNHTRELHESLNRCDTRRSDRFIQRNLFFAYVRFIRRATYYLHVDCSIRRKGRFEFHQNSQTSSFPKRNKIFMHKMTEVFGYL